MKKFLYLLLFAFVTSMAVTSCTEEEVKPKNEGGGGIFMDPKNSN